ncbi:MAG: RuvA C-terminal domain-containing protein [Dehalococcoidales bacterium]|nr:RuvA C-terminal domain-containing protein [Dehalococcoidales bacterium]
MKILTGSRASNQKEAVSLALQEAGIGLMSPDVVDVFASVAENAKTSTEIDKLVGTSVRGRYGNKASWRAERWFVPVPKLQFQGKDIHQLLIEVSVYLVAAAVVRTVDDSRLITVAGPVGKPEMVSIPMVFLHALLENDLGRFAMVARDASYTTWEVPGAKPVRLPNDFVNELSKIFKYQSVVSWLCQFGTQGRCVAPLVAGSLIGLAFQDSSQPVPANKEMVTTDNLASALHGLAYQPAEAREMVSRVSSRLRADMTLEEAIRLTLEIGKGVE